MVEFREEFGRIRGSFFNIFLNNGTEYLFEGSPALIALIMKYILKPRRPFNSS